MATKKTTATSKEAAAHPIALVRSRLSAAGLEKWLLRPFAELVPRLFRFSRRGARLAERLIVDRPLLSTSAALAELSGHVQDPVEQRLHQKSWSPHRSPVASGIPRVLVDKLAYALHALIDEEGAAAPQAVDRFDFGEGVVPGPVPPELRGLLVAVEQLQKTLRAGNTTTTAEALTSHKRARLTLDEGPPAGFFFTEDTAAVPRGMLLAIDDVETRGVGWVGVRGPLLDRETQAYALERVLDVIHDPIFDERARLVRLAGGRYGALLAALDELVVVDEDAPRLVWRVLLKSGGPALVPVVRGAASSGKALGDDEKLSGKRLEDAVRALPFATPQDLEIARAWVARRERLDGKVADALVDHPFLELHDGRALKALHARAVVVVKDDQSLSFAALGRAVDAGALGEDGSAAVVDAERGHVLAVLVTPQQQQLARAVDRLGAQPLPLRVLDDVVSRLKKSNLEVLLPLALRGQKVAPSSTLLVRVAWKGTKAGGHGGARFSVVARPLPSGPTFVPGTGPAVVFADEQGRAVWCERDLSAEDRAALALLDDVGVEDDDVDGPFRFALLSPERALATLATLAERDDVVLAFTAEGPKVESVRASQLRVRLSKRTDWLGLDGAVALDDGTRLELLPVLEAMREGRRWVVIDKDRIAALSTEIIEKLGVVAALTGNESKLARAAVAVVDDAFKALAEAGAAVERDAGWDVDVAAAAKDVDGRAAAGIAATLRPYQEEGLRFLRRLANWQTGGILADDMGLGKTLVTTCLLHDRGPAGPQLVVAPTSVCLHWKSEIEKFAPQLKPRVYADADDRAAAVDDAGANDVIIASYGLVQRDAARIFAGTRFTTLVVDEAQAVKNATTSRAKALRLLRADFRVALTGTPIENHTGELWSIFDLVSPGLFGTFQQWKARWASPIEKDEDDKRRRLLARAIQPFLLRRKKSDVAKDLPPRTVVTRLLTPSPEEHHAYERLRTALVAEIERGRDEDGKRNKDEEQTPARKRALILAALTKLRLCACHPVFASDVVDHDAVPLGTKHRALLELTAELKEAGHKALVFSQFVMHLRLAERFLVEAGFRVQVLTGETPMAERQRLVEQFQAGDADVFLISLKAGGFGLNLTRASYVVHLDPWWNPAAEDQASDRAHRIGQTLPVTVVRLVMAQTLEEPILELHARKKSLADGVLDGTDVAGALSLDELLDLVKSSRRYEGSGGQERALAGAGVIDVDGDD